MTDFSGKFVVYYNIVVSNPNTGAGETIPAVFNVSLDYPLINKADDYVLAIVKAKVFGLQTYGTNPPTAPLNLVDKILINSTTLSIIGSLYSNNLQSQTILDIDFNQSTGENTDPVYFVPPYPICLTLNNPTPIQVINLAAFVQFNDGTQAPMQIPPGQTFSCRLAFIRKF
jgi:hypothetical protein